MQSTGANRLAIDVGGTKIDIALFSAASQLLRHERFSTKDYPSLLPVIAAFAPQDLACIGIAIGGPVTSRAEKLTNLDWVIDAMKYKKHLQ